MTRLRRRCTRLSRGITAECSAWPGQGKKANGGGAIIGSGSISWRLGLPDLLLYETAKGGIEGVTRALAREPGPFGTG